MSELPSSNLTATQRVPSLGLGQASPGLTGDAFSRVDDVRSPHRVDQVQLKDHAPRTASNTAWCRHGQMTVGQQGILTEKLPSPGRHRGRAPQPLQVDEERAFIQAEGLIVRKFSLNVRP